jgi:hypothetical protein
MLCLIRFAHATRFYLQRQILPCRTPFVSIVSDSQKTKRPETFYKLISRSYGYGFVRKLRIFLVRRPTEHAPDRARLGVHFAQALRSASDEWALSSRPFHSVSVLRPGAWKNLLNPKKQKAVSFRLKPIFG